MDANKRADIENAVEVLSDYCNEFDDCNGCIFCKPNEEFNRICFFEMYCADMWRDEFMQMMYGGDR